MYQCINRSLSFISFLQTVRKVDIMKDNWNVRVVGAKVLQSMFLMQSSLR